MNRSAVAPFFGSIAAAAALLLVSYPSTCGAQWVREEIPGADVKTIAFDSANPGLVLAGTTSGQLYRSPDAGSSWRSPAGDLPFPGHVVSRITADPSTPRRFYAALWRLFGEGGSVVRSDDAGETWQRLDSLPDAQFRAIAVAPGAPDVIYAGGERGVWRSTDGGINFVHVTPDKIEWSRVESLAVDRRTPLRVYAGTWRRAYRSDDGGKRWTPIWKGMIEDTDVFSLSLDPGFPDALWATTCGWVYRTTNRGELWVRMIDGFVNRRVPAFARGDAGTLFAASCGGLHVSCDGGRSWMLSGFPDETVSDISIDPFDGNRILAAIEDDGIYRSEDGGSTWSRSSKGLAGGQPIEASATASGGLRAVVKQGKRTTVWTREPFGAWALADKELEAERERSRSVPRPQCQAANEAVAALHSPLPGLPIRGVCAGENGESLILTAGCGLYRTLASPSSPASAASFSSGQTPADPVAEAR